jgi:hypothetical protein
MQEWQYDMSKVVPTHNEIATFDDGVTKLKVRKNNPKSDIFNFEQLPLGLPSEGQ